MAEPAFSGGPWGSNLVLRVLPATAAEFDEVLAAASQSFSSSPSTDTSSSSSVNDVEAKTELEATKVTPEVKVSLEQEEVPTALLKTALTSLPQVQDPVATKKLQEKQAKEAKRAKKLEESKAAEATARLEVEQASKKLQEAKTSSAAPAIVEALFAVKVATEAKALQASKQAWALEQEAVAALTTNNVMDVSQAPHKRPVTNAVLSLPFPPPARGVAAKPIVNTKELVVIRHTLGEIDPINTVIVIQFNQPILAAASEEDLKTESTDGLVSVSPVVPGRWVWASVDTLEFRPKERFQYSTQYEVVLNSNVLATPNGLKLPTDFSFSFNTFYLRIQNAQEIQSRYLSAKNRRPLFSLIFNQTVNVEYLRERISLARLGSKEVVACTLSDGCVLQPVAPLSFHFPWAIRVAAGTKGIEGNVGLPTNLDLPLYVSSLVFERFSLLSATLTLVFSQPLGDPRDLAFLSANNYLEPPVQGEWRVSEQNDCYAQFMPVTPLAPGSYTVTLPQGLCSSLGMALHNEHKPVTVSVPYPSIIDTYFPMWKTQEEETYLLATQPVVGIIFSRPMARESLQYITAVSYSRELEGKEVLKLFSETFADQTVPLTWLTDEEEQALIASKHPASFPERKQPSDSFRAFRPTNPIPNDHVFIVTYECPTSSTPQRRQQPNLWEFFTFKQLDVDGEGPNNTHPQSLLLNFNQPMLMGASSSSVFPEECKSDPFGIQFEADGNWSWLNAQQLRFNFTGVPAWPQNFQIKFPKNIHSLVEGSSKSPFEVSVAASMPRLQQFWPKGYAHILQPYILLQFNRPLAFDKLSSLIWLSTSGSDALELTYISQIPEVSSEFSAVQAQTMIENPQSCVLFKVAKPLRRGAQYAVKVGEKTVLFEFKAPAEHFTTDVSVVSEEPLRLRLKFTVPPASLDFPELQSTDGTVPPGQWIWQDANTLEYLGSASLPYPYHLRLLPVKGLKSTFGDELSPEMEKIEFEQPRLANYFVTHSHSNKNKICVLDTRPAILLRFNRSIAPVSVLPLISCELNKLMHLGSKTAQLELVEGEEANAMWTRARDSEKVSGLQGLTPQSDLNWMVIRPITELARDNNYHIRLGNKIMDLKLFVAKPLAVEIKRMNIPDSILFEFTQPMVPDFDPLVGSPVEKKLDIKNIVIDPPLEDAGEWQWKSPFSLQLLIKAGCGFAIGQQYTVTVPKGTCSLLTDASKLEKDEVLEVFENVPIWTPHVFASASSNPVLFFEFHRLVSHQHILALTQVKSGKKKDIPFQLAYGEEDNKLLKTYIATATRFPDVLSRLISEYIDLFQDVLQEEEKKFAAASTTNPKHHLLLRVMLSETDIPSTSEITVSIPKFQFSFSFFPQSLLEAKLYEGNALPTVVFGKSEPRWKETINTSLIMTPFVAGKWVWRQNHILEFQPAGGRGTLPFSTKYTITIPAKQRFERGVMGPKPTIFEITTPAPEVLYSTVSQGKYDQRSKKWSDVSPHAFVVLIFNQPADLPTIKPFLRATTGSFEYEIVPLNSKQKQAAESLISNARSEAGALAGSSLAASPVCFAFRQSLTRGFILEISLSNVVLKEGPIPMASPWSLSLDVLPPTKALPYNEHPEPRTSWDLRFSGPLARTLPENCVQISPALQFQDAEVDPVDRSLIHLRNTSKPLTTYTVTLTGLVDESGDKVPDCKFQVKTGTMPPMESPTVIMPSGAQGGRMVLIAPRGEILLPVTSINCVKFVVEVFTTTATEKNIKKFFDHDKTSGRSSKISVGVEVEGPFEQTVTHLALGPYLKEFGHLIVQAQPMASKKEVGPAVSVWVQSSKLSLQTHMGPSELLVWVTSLDGKPVGNAQVEYESLRGTTDAAGVCSLAIPATFKAIGARVRATLGEDVVFSAELFPLSRSIDSAAPSLAWFVFDDRRLYQPGEKVHVKGTVRWLSVDEKTQGNPSLPSLVDGKLEYKVLDGNSREISRGDVESLVLGSFDVEFDLPANCSTGAGRVNFTLTPATLPHGLIIAKTKAKDNILLQEESKEKPPTWTNTHSFEIQAFRRPEFLVKIRKAGPDPVIADPEALNRVLMQLQATYLAGGPLADATAKWQVQARAAHFAPAGWPSFTFGNESEPGNVHILRLDGVCDDSGAHALQIQFKGQESHCIPLHVKAKAEVIDATQLKSEDEASFIIHPCARYIGASLPVVKPVPNLKWPVLVLVCDPNGQLVGGETVYVYIKSVKPGRDQRGRLIVDEKEFSVQALSERPAMVELEFAIGGKYSISFSTTKTHFDNNSSNQEERKVNEIVKASSCVMNVNVEGGFEPRKASAGIVKAALLPQDQLIINSIEKKAFEGGETVRLRVQCPFSHGMGLVLLSSNGHVGAPSPFSVNDGEGEASFIVKSEWAPNVRALIQVVGSQTSPFARPAYAYGTIDIRLSLASKSLVIKLSPTSENELGVPGGSITTKVSVMEPLSTRPVAGASVCVVLVDEAVLSLTNYQLSNPVYTFFPPRALELLTSSTTWSDCLLIQKPKPLTEWGPEERMSWLSNAIESESKRKLMAQARWEESKAGLMMLKVRSRDIDRKLSSYHQTDQVLVKILVLGSKESGRNTLLTQLQDIYGRGFDETEIQSYWSLVRLTVAYELQKAIPQLPELEALIASIESNADTIFKEEDYQQCLLLRPKLDLSLTGGFFLSHLEEYFGPTDKKNKKTSLSFKDCIRTHVRNRNMLRETKISIDGNEFELYTPNQDQNESRKWIHAFEAVSAVIYVANILSIWDPDSELFAEELLRFESIATSRWFHQTSVILFLNKRDLVQEKLKTHPLPSSPPFHNFKGNRNNYDEVIAFIETLYINAATADKLIYCHITCATDSNNVHAVFGAVKDILIRCSLSCAGLCGGGGGGGGFSFPLSSSGGRSGSGNDERARKHSDTPTFSSSSSPSSSSSSSPPPQAPPKPSIKPSSSSSCSSSEEVGEMAVARERNNFDPLACWAAALITDADGCASVVIKLPDSTTKYRCYAVASTPTLFGLQEASLAVQLPLSLRPTAPRFLNFGDEARVVLVVQNLTNVRVEVWVGVRILNAQVRLPHVKGAGTDAVGAKVVVPPNGRVSANFLVSNIESPSFPVLLQCFALASSFSDAVLLRVPVQPPATSQAFALQGEVTGDNEGSAEIPVKIPDTKLVWPAVGGLRLAVAVTQLQGLIQAAVYLFTFSFENTEQLSARILGLLSLAPVLSQFRSPLLPSDSELFETLSKNVTALSNRQHQPASFLKKADSDPGAIGCWTKGGYIVLISSIQSALALAFFLQTYPKMKKKVLTTLIPLVKWIESLTSELKVQRATAGWGVSARLAILALAAYTRVKVAKVVIESSWVPQRVLPDLEQLARTEPKEWSLEGAAWLCSTFHALGELERAKPFLDFIVNNIETVNGVTQLKQTQPYNSHFGVSDWCMLWSEARSEAVVLDCLLQCDPSHALIASLSRALLARRDKGRWGNTQENVWAIMALYRFACLKEDAIPRLEAQAWINDVFMGSSRFDSRTLLTKQCELPMTELTRENTDNAKHRTLLVHKQGAGCLYYTISLNFAKRDLSIPAFPGAFVVTRTYQSDLSRGGSREDVTLDPTTGEWHIRLGASVTAIVVVQIGKEHADVAVVDPLPAGLEPLLSLSADGTNNVKEWFEHRNVRDDSVEVFAALLHPGKYQFTTALRAVSAGRFIVPPARGEEQYHADDEFGTSKSDVVHVL